MRQKVDRGRELDGSKSFGANSICLALIDNRNCSCLNGIGYSGRFAVVQRHCCVTDHELFETP